MIVDGIEVIGAPISEEEARYYLKHAPEGTTRMQVELDGDYANVWFSEMVPFERIRRITGYLVGSLDRFNDAKLAEVRDRVKHEIQPTGLRGGDN